MMVKINRPGSHTHKTSPSPMQSDRPQPAQQVSRTPSAAHASQKKGRTNSKDRVGGTAVQGARSTQPKELTTGKPADQQAEYYNRETRRRMQQMGTGPYTERADPRDRRKKRQEKLQERQDRMKQRVNAKGPSRDIKLGRRNTYFLIGTIIVLIILFIIFVIVRHPF